MTRSRCWIGAAALGAVMATLGTGTAAAASLSDASLTIQPSQLPKQGGAPVTATVAGTIDQNEASEGVRAVTLRLDRQLVISGKGHPTCKGTELSGHDVTEARQKCKAALVGSGKLSQQIPSPEGGAPVGDVTGSVLFFNGAAEHLITYVFFPGAFPPVAAWTVGKAAGRTAEIRLPQPVGDLTTSFRFHLGRTWSKDGRKVGYLSGRCATGALHNKIALALSGRTETASLTQRCQGKG